MKFLEVGEFPHMAAIGFGDEVDENKFSYDCGGSLISKVIFLRKYFKIIFNNLNLLEVCSDGGLVAYAKIAFSSYNFFLQRSLRK